MKNIVYIFFILLCISCSNNRKMKSENSVAEFEDIIEEKNSEVLETNKFENLSIQKFNDYVDLLKLKEKHPEFKVDILKQLLSISTDTLINMNDETTFSIKNVHQLGNVEQISDSVQKIKLVYNIIIDGRKTKDSVFALITSKTIILDNNEIMSNKVKLLKELKIR